MFAKYKMPYISITPTFSICQGARIYCGRAFYLPRVRQGRRGVEPRGGLSAAGAELQSRQEGRIYAAQKVRYLIFLTAEPRGILSKRAARRLLCAAAVACSCSFVRRLFCAAAVVHFVRRLLRAAAVVRCAQRLCIALNGFRRGRSWMKAAFG